MITESNRTAIYCRISSDRAGAGLGVARQEKECRELAHRLGWTISAIFTDNDISAYSGKTRPGYAALLAAIKNRDVDGLIVWHTDRLHRNVRELLDFIDVLRDVEYEFLVRTVQAGPVDISTPTGRALAVTFGAWAQQESEHKAERIRSKHRELAENGREKGGGHRPFGYEQDRVNIRESEATLIRDATHKILNQGMSLSGICRDWKDAGVQTVSGGRWTPHVLRRVLMSARISGRREHRKVKNLGEITAKAEWPAIISADDSDRLRELLSDPSRTTNGGINARKYLLSGYLYCGIEGCGRRLIARPQGDHQRSYVCAEIGRAHLRVHAESLELYVTEVMLDYLGEFVNLAAAIRSRSESGQESKLWSELRDYQTRLEQAEHAFWVAGKMSEATFQRVTRDLEANVQRVRHSLSLFRYDAVLADVPVAPTLTRERWERSGLAWRRLLLGALIERVTVGPGLRGRNRFDPDRIQTTFRRPE